MPLITHRLPGLVLTDHEFRIPLDHSRPDGEQVTVFAREAVAPGKEQAELPWLVFLQGGPGGKSPRPAVPGDWLKRALEEFRVLLLDQRGTGRSTPANRQTLTRRGGPRAQAEYLMHFRADAIVRDAEYIREALLGPGGRWSILGQSYGGFCALTYLSFAPAGLREVFVAGGLPPIDRSADDVYRMTYPRVREQNRRYFERYPADQERAQVIATHLAASDVRLPNGDRLTPRRLQMLGLAFGMSDGFERVHYLLDEAFVDGAGGSSLSDTFLYGVMDAVSFADRPLFAILQEPIHCQGAGGHWSAERIRDEYPEFAQDPGRPFYFTGEMIYPWLFEEDGALYALKEATEILAHHDDWPRLYDADRLRANTVPCAAVIYADDMYVDRVFSEQTARAIGGCRFWLTNELQHDGLRADGAAVLGRLIALARGEQ
jgi:pimeloyl-ACP methyl ester carboxylesterase